MGSFTGITGALVGSCAGIAQSRIKKLAEKVKLYFFRVKLLFVIVKKENTVDIIS